jgi:hypothetical protein
VERNIYQSRTFRLALLLGGLVVPIVTFAHQQNSVAPESSDHVCLKPEVQPTGQSSCTVEAVAYAVALTALEDARKAANEAYRRWYECEYQGQGVKPVVSAPSSEFSVLVRD